MKPMNVYKDAVMYRVGEKKRERTKQTRRILAICLPLCLCLGIVGVTVLPRALQIGEDRIPELNGDSSTGTPEATVFCGDAVIAVKEPDVTYEAILALYETKKTVADGVSEESVGITFGGPVDGADGSADQESVLEDNSLNGSLPWCYLCFQRPEGTHVFLLQNSILTDLSIGESVTVTDEQAQALINGEAP